MIEAKSAAVILVDLQVGILRYPFAPHRTDEVRDSSLELLRAARRSGALAVFTRVVYAPDFADALQQPVDRPLPGGGSLAPDWAEFPGELVVSAADVVVDKRQWGAFYGTDLDLQLRRRGIGTLILAGVSTNMGVESTARDAWERGYSLIFAEDAISAMAEHQHAFAIQEIFPLIGRVKSTAEIINMLK